MKFSLATILTLALAAAAIPAPDVSKKTYDGTKVIRVSIPDSAESAARLEALVTKLDLSLWSRNFLPNGVVDVQVPKDLVDEFEASTLEWKKMVMFEDLGESIRMEETSIAPSEGEVRINSGKLMRYEWEDIS